MYKKVNILENLDPIEKMYLRFFNACANDNDRVLVIHALYDIEYDETAEALTGFMTGQSLNFQAYFDSITPNWDYIKASRVITNVNRKLNILRLIMDKFNPKNWIKF